VPALGQKTRKVLCKFPQKKFQPSVRDERVVLDALVASVWVFQSELAKLWPSPLAWLWAAVV
jgi:hypothetical protein